MKIKNPAEERENGLLSEVDFHDWIVFLPMSNANRALCSKC